MYFQVIHNNNPQIGPYKVGPPKKSEYSKEFKAWKYKPILSKDDAAAEKQRGLTRNLRASQVSYSNHSAGISLSNPAQVV